MTPERLKKIKNMAAEGDSVTSPVVYELAEEVQRLNLQIREERERCAKVVEGFLSDDFDIDTLNLDQLFKLVASKIREGAGKPLCEDRSHIWINWKCDICGVAEKPKCEHKRLSEVVYDGNKRPCLDCEQDVIEKPKCDYTESPPAQLP